MEPARVPELNFPFDCEGTEIATLLVDVYDGLATLEGVRVAELLAG
jgi:hypothetical protein